MVQSADGTGFHCSHQFDGANVTRFQFSLTVGQEPTTHSPQSSSFQLFSSRYEPEPETAHGISLSRSSSRKISDSDGTHVSREEGEASRPSPTLPLEEQVKELREEGDNLRAMYDMVSCSISALTVEPLNNRQISVCSSERDFLFRRQKYRLLHQKVYIYSVYRGVLYSKCPLLEVPCI